MDESASHHHQVHSSPSHPPTTDSIDSTASRDAQVLASIVQLCVDVMAKCVSIDHSGTTVNIAPGLIAASDFECALCTA